MSETHLFTRALTSALIVCGATALTLTAGCSGSRTRVYAAPPSASVSVSSSPRMVALDNGVWVVSNRADPVFYRGDYYWRYDRGTWYRSSYLGGWSPVATAIVPAPIVSIRRPARYRRYHAPPSARVRVAPNARVRVRGPRGARVRVRGPRGPRVRSRGRSGRVRSNPPRARVRVRGRSGGARVRVRGSSDRGRANRGSNARGNGRARARGRSDGRGRGASRGNSRVRVRSGRSGRGARVRVRGD